MVRSTVWLGLLVWGRLNAMCQAGTTTSVTWDRVGFMRCSSQLLRLGQGCGTRGPGSVCSLPCALQVLHEAFKTKGMFGEV